MNARQRALYNFLINKGDKFTPQAEVAVELYDYYGNAEAYFDPTAFHMTPKRRMLTADILAINLSDETEKIIISTGKGVKIANREEYIRYIKSQYKSVFKKLGKIRFIEKKASANAQMNIDGNSVDAFIEKIKKDIDKEI